MKKINKNNRSFNIISNNKLDISSNQNILKNTVVWSPSRKLELNNNSIVLKKSGTNTNILNNSELCTSQKSFNIIKKKTRRKSLKFIEKNIKNRLLDISMQIEKEENISCINQRDNNLNISTLIKNKIDGESEISSPKNRLSVNFIRTKKKFSEVKNFKLEISDNNSKNNLSKNEVHQINSFQKVINKKNNENDKFRVLLQKNILYDSFNSEEEKENEEERFFISPVGNFVLIFDSLIIIFSLFDIVYTPFRLSNIDGFCSPQNKCINLIYYIIDILYIFDLILGFMRSYFNFQFIIIKNKPRIVRHYIKTQFWFDFFQAFPVFTYINYVCKKKKYPYCNAYDLNNTEMFLLLFCFVKQIKLFKIIDLKKNSIMYKMKESTSEREFFEDIINSIVTIGVCIFCFYSFISIHIFIGRHCHPNWITKNGFQNQSIPMLYLTSFYYLITTMTTVGYGDISCASLSEIIFQIVVLSVGITVYSWIVSNIGNYVKNENYASMQFNRDGEILEEIRISHPNMPFRLYNQILHFLNARKIRQKLCDSNLLINSLPYSLKNSVLLTMYKQTIDNLKIFKGCKNSDFIVRILTNFIPLFSKKNAILIHEGQLVENIMFVKNGRLALQAAIDIEEPEESIKHYLNKNFGDVSDDLMFISKYESSNTNSSNYSKAGQTPVDIAKTIFDTVVNTRTRSEANSVMNESGLGKEMGKWDLGGEDFEESNYQFLNIINLSKNESYGVIYMFLNKASPLSLRVKSKKVELLLLRKIDAMDISQRYPNIWMKFIKKSYFNILSIKKIAVKKIQHFWDNLEKKSKMKKPLMKSKTLLNHFTLYKFKNSEFNEIKKISNEQNHCLTTKNKAKVLKRQCVSIGLKDMNIGEILNPSKKSKKTKPNFSNFQNEYIDLTKKNNGNSKFVNNSKENGSSDKNNGNSDKTKISTNYNSGIKNPVVKKVCFTNHNKNKNKDMRNNRTKNINRLKAEIKKLKNSKKYYKELCHKLTSSKRIDTNFVANNFNDALLTNLSKKKNNVPDVQLSAKNINIFHSVKPNIINNITIKNSNQFICKSNKSYNESERKDVDKRKKNKKEEKEEEFSNELDLEFSESEGSEKKSYLDELEINSEIKIYYKAKYLNIDNYTDGEFSKNEELRKETLNFIKVFIEIEKKKKNKKAQTRTIKEKDKILNPYTNNYDFRHILTKINLDWRSRGSNFNSYKTINTKKEKISDKSSNNVMNKSHDSILTLFKNNNTNTKSEYKKYKSKKTKNSNSYSVKKNLSSLKNKNKTLFNTKNKTLNLIGDSKSKKGSVAFLKLPNKKNTLNEWEQEIELNKSNNNIYGLNKTISINSEDQKFEKSLTNNNSISNFKSVSDNQVFQFNG